MEAFQDTVYMFKMEDNYTVMIQRDLDATIEPYINFYIKRKSESHWIHCFGLASDMDYTEIVGAPVVNWNNMQHIIKCFNYYKDDIDKIDKKLYEEIVEELEKAEMEI